MTFQDHFARVSEGYARFRPQYPAALFDYLAGTVDAHGIAWDCATGNGQAAVGLAEQFTRVVATDASADQLRHATPRPNIEYRQADAGDSGLPSHSVDLVTCAQAAHWLPRDLFYAEARRVLAPGGVVAIWGYHIPVAGDDLVDAGIRHFHDVVVGPYWPPERRLVLDRFATIAFPFDEIACPEFEMPARGRSTTSHATWAPSRRPIGIAWRTAAKTRCPPWWRRFSRSGARSATCGSPSSCGPAGRADAPAVPPFVPANRPRGEQTYEDLR